MMTSAVGGSHLNGSKMSYKDFATEMSRLLLFEPVDQDTVDYLDAEFKSRYPGNYQMEWTMNQSINNISCSITFDTPEDETMFLLRYL